MDQITNYNYARLFAESQALEMQKAQYRDYFYEQDNTVIKSILMTDLSKFYDSGDIGNMHLITLDYFVHSFLEKVCNVYDNAPIFKFSEKVKPEQKDRFKALLDEIKINQLMQSNFHKIKLHNTILVHIKYNQELDVVFVENDYNIGSTWVLPYSDYQLEPRVVAYQVIQDGQDDYWVVWDRRKKEHYKIKDAPKYDPESDSILNDKIMLTYPGYWPFVTYRYRNDNNNFWGNGIDWLVDLVKSINILFTVCNDDTIRETIRLLILNFNPSGNKGEKGQLKTGLQHPIMPEGRMPGNESPAGQVVSAQLFNEQIIAFVEKLTDIVSSMYGIDNIMKMNLQENLAGVSIRLKNEPLMRQWAKDIDIMKPYDMQLIRVLVATNNYYRKQKIDEAVLSELQIEYQEPNIVTDEAAEYELEKTKWRDGTSSPVLYVMRKNPEMNEKEAREYIKNNKKVYDELFGIDFAVPGSTEEIVNGKENPKDEGKQKTEQDDTEKNE